MTKARIREFIKEFCDEVYDMPDHALELHMDNHKCFQWYGRQYFVSESLSYWGQDAQECEDIWEHLVYNHGL